MMQLATALHQARKRDAAAALYEKVLALDPGDADALHLLGVARGQGGDNKAALALIGKAIVITIRYSLGSDSYNGPMSKAG